jgi:ribosomal protein S18 acetylase RimI-like enzyme
MNICKLDIRALTSDQFEQIVAIEENCGLEPYSREMLLDCIENLHTYASMDGTTVAGFITLMASSPRLGGGLYIVNLNVAKPYRRQGLARKLITTVCGLYRDSHRGSFVILDVAKDNSAAWHLYKKLGFDVTDIPSRNGDTDVVMMAKLDWLCRNP